MFFFHLFHSILVPFCGKKNETEMERYIPPFVVKVENGMEWNATPFCRPMNRRGFKLCTDLKFVGFQGFSALITETQGFF